MTTKVTVTFSRVIEPDTNPDLSFLEQDYADLPEELRAIYKAQDKMRLEEYEEGAWEMVGVRAKATIAINHGHSITTYTLTSPGVWGVESDSGEEHLREMYETECDVLRADIEALRQARNLCGR